jgi:hypothetical protein
MFMVTDIKTFITTYKECVVETPYKKTIEIERDNKSFALCCCNRTVLRKVRV